MKNIQQFKKGTYHILVATDVAARGIHVEDLSLVINYDVPQDLDNYIHRIGRTGRAGHEGKAISLVTTDDLMTLYQIEEHIGTLIPEAELPTNQELAEQKELSDAWVKAHSLKHQPGKQQPAAASRKGKGKKGTGTDSRKKGYHKKSYNKGGQKQHYKSKQGAGQGKGKKPYTNQKDRDAYKKAPAAQQKRAADKKYVPDRQHSPAKPQTTPQAKVQTAATPKKKPFFERILGKLLGE